MSDTFKMAAKAGEHVITFARRMLVEAYIRGGKVEGTFNQHTLIAKPGSCVPDIVKPFDDWERKSYMER